MRSQEDEEYERGRLTRKMEAGEDVVLQSEMAAVIQNTANPKAEYHFIVLPKVDIVNVTAVSRCTNLCLILSNLTDPTRTRCS